jgi:hypothetical protein
VRDPQPGPLTAGDVAMEIRFYCVHNGKKFYKVLLHGEEIFCGTKAESQRFIKIHNDKVQKSVADGTGPRPRPGNVRIYRRRTGAPGV